ncbi:MAG: YceI family protein [Acidimicrobiales bacterium]
MYVGPGTHELGPHCGTVRLRTYRQGLAARAGHDLVLEASAWQGNVVVPDDPGATPTVFVEIDLRSLHVIEGSGGVKPLTDGDKEDIRSAMQKPLRTAEHPTATFRSTAMRRDDDRVTLEGELSLAGQVHPVVLELRGEVDDTVVGHTEIVQTQWGIKPYVGLLGALKLRDDVGVDVSVSLPG